MSVALFLALTALLPRLPAAIAIAGNTPPFGIVMSSNASASNPKDFYAVQAGFRVHRLMAGSIPMTLTVTKVTEQLIVCGGGWTFDRRTGIEVDEELGWGVDYGITGSQLVGWEEPLEV